MKKHESQRGYFAYELHQQMIKNKDIYLITADLGYGVFTAIQDDFSDRFINCGASEQAMLGMGVGLALEGKIPFCYSITTFLLYRPFEWIRNYLDHEKIPVRLVGSGRGKDYKVDGFSHDATDAPTFLHEFRNIETYYPADKEEIPYFVNRMIANDTPSFISLKR